MHVNAATNFGQLLASTSPVDESAQNVSIVFGLEPTQSYIDINGGTYSGSASGTSTINNGSVASPKDSQWNFGAGGTITGTQSITLTGSGSESGTLSTYSYSGTINRLTVSGSSSVSNMAWITSNSSANYINPEEFNLSGSSNVSTNNSGTISLSTTHGGSLRVHCKYPLIVNMPYVTDGSIDPNKYYGFFISCANVTHSQNPNTGSNIYFSNYQLTAENGEVLTTGFTSTGARNCFFMIGSELLSHTNNYVSIPIYVEFNAFCESLTQPFRDTINFDIYPRLRLVNESYQSVVGNNVSSDPIQHKLQESTNSKIDTQIEQENSAQQTRTGILQKITDFFGAFFDNLIGVFVPESGYFETWFNRVNTLLADKLGILYYPFNYLISFLNDILSYLSNSDYRTHCYIQFPAIEFTNVATNETYTFYQGTTVDLATFNVNISGNEYITDNGLTNFSSLAQTIRIFNSVCIIFALFNLCYRKLKLIMEGHEDDN